MLKQRFNAPGSKIAFINSIGFSMLFFLLLFAIFSLLVPDFFSLNNFINILNQSAVLGVAALALAVVIISGNMDLSIGSIISFSCTFVALAMTSLRLPLPLAVLLAVLSGVCLGLFNGLMVAYTGLNSLIITYLSMNFFSGLSYVICNNNPISGLPKAFYLLGRGTILRIPISFLLMLVIACGINFFLRNSFWGKYIFALGSNIKTAHLSGIPVKETQILTFAVCGLLAGCGGVILASRINYGIADAGSGYEFTSLVIVILSNVALSGGRGSVLTIITGSLTYSSICTALILLNVSFYGQQTIIGILVFAFALLNMRFRHFVESK